VRAGQTRSVASSSTSAGPIVAIRAEGADLHPDLHGAKAVGLQRLLRYGLPVPEALVVPIDTAYAIKAQRLDADELVALSRQLSGPRQERLAVRSGGPHSLPGALISVFDVDPDSVPEALATVLRSADQTHVKPIAEALGVSEPTRSAVIVQRQLDTTADPRSGAGVATSCDPVNGQPGARGSFAWAQRGAAVMAAEVPVESLATLDEHLGELHRRILNDLQRIADQEASPVELEFAITSGELWYLQLRRFSAPEFTIEPATTGTVIGYGHAGSAGVGRGCLHVNVDDALDAIDHGQPVVLALPTTSPGEVPAIVGCAGLITIIGGRDSHAAVVARNVGVPAVLGVAGLRIVGGGIFIDGRQVPVGAELVVDGSNGQLVLPTDD